MQLKISFLFLYIKHGLIALIRLLIFSNCSIVKGFWCHSLGKGLLASKCCCLELNQILRKQKSKVVKPSETFVMDRKNSRISMEISSVEAWSRQTLATGSDKEKSFLGCVLPLQKLLDSRFSLSIWTFKDKIDFCQEAWKIKQQNQSRSILLNKIILIHATGSHVCLQLPQKA